MLAEAKMCLGLQILLHLTDPDGAVIHIFLEQYPDGTVISTPAVILSHDSNNTVCILQDQVFCDRGVVPAAEPKCEQASVDWFLFRDIPAPLNGQDLKTALQLIQHFQLIPDASFQCVRSSFFIGKSENVLHLLHGDHQKEKKILPRYHLHHPCQYAPTGQNHTVLNATAGHRIDRWKGCGSYVWDSRYGWNQK